MSDIDVRRTLPLHLTWLLGAAMAWQTVRLLGNDWFGIDSHAYWAAWQGDWRTRMYDIAPNHLDAFNYSPAFAQAIWPLAQLPWPAFGVLWSVGSAVAFFYLLRPLGWAWLVPLAAFVAPEVFVGNNYAMLALVAVWGLSPGPARQGAWWVLVVLTKVTPALGPVWFAVRREWRHLAVSVGATVAVVVVSYLLTPQLWHQWVDFLLSNESSTEKVGISAPALAFRLPAALALVAWGAHTDRRWTVPVAMALAVPVASTTALTLLAAIPRLRHQDEVSRS